MRGNRNFHVYVGCFFAPLLIYFALSGAWQVFRLHDLPKDHPSTLTQRVLHDLSNPHRDSTLPGKDPRQAESIVFKFISVLMALGFIMTAVIGIQMGVQVKQRRRRIIACVLAGIIVPVLFLFLSL